MSLITSVATYIQQQTGFTRGQELFIGQAPSSREVPSTIIWIIPSGGDRSVISETGGGIKDYQVDIYMRDPSPAALMDRMFQLEENLNCAKCVELEDFETIDVAATTFPIDQDLDSEDRKVGLITATFRVFKNC